MLLHEERGLRIVVDEFVSERVDNIGVKDRTLRFPKCSSSELLCEKAERVTGKGGLGIQTRGDRY